MTLNKIKKLKFKNFIDVNGILVPIEGETSVPFKIARIFYILNVPKGEIRGQHAHKKCQQLLICLQGECEITCENGKSKKTFKLNSPDQGLYIPPMIWSTQKFIQKNSFLLVLADQKFSESDYIRDYNQFLKSI